MPNAKRQRTARLYVLIARNAAKAVVFRRGPSKQVACLAWDLRKDSFELGQWFKGRIYERRCDLSPSGELLVYFAANWKAGFGSWTAVSRTPYLHALMLWPKGDAWGGGGLFDSEAKLALNHGAREQKLAPGQQLPRGFSVVSHGPRPGGGEDRPIEAVRRARDGWVLARAAKWQPHQPRGAVRFPVRPGDEQILSKPQPEFLKRTAQAEQRTGHAKPRQPVVLEELLLGIAERDSSWYMTEHRLVNHDSAACVSLGRTDWADWDHGGDLLFARAGRLYRLAAKHARNLALEAARELVDLSPLRFEARAAPYIAPGEPDSV